MNIRQHVARELVQSASKKTQVGDAVRSSWNIFVFLVLGFFFLLVLVFGGIGVLQQNIRQHSVNQQQGFREVITVCWQNPCPTQRAPVK